MNLNHLGNPDFQGFLGMQIGFIYLGIAIYVLALLGPATIATILVLTRKPSSVQTEKSALPPSEIKRAA